MTQRRSTSAVVQSIRRYASDAAPKTTSQPPTPQYRKPTTPRPIVNVNASTSAQISTPTETIPERPDPARGARESVRVAQGGKLDPRYRPAARRVLAIIVAAPFAIYLTYELAQRRFMGKEQRKIPTKDDTIISG